MVQSISSVSGPAVWRGVDVQDRDEWRFDLTPAHVAEVERALAATSSMELTTITADDFEMPTLGAVLRGFVDDLVVGRGFVLIRGVPVDGLSADELARVFWGIGQYLGVPIPQNDAGDHLVHIRDEGLDFSDRTVRGYQTAAALSYHSDSSDVVGLLCVRPAREGGVSTVVSASAVFNEAVRRRPDLVDVLMQPWWWDRRKKDPAESFFQCRIFGIESGRLTSYYGRSHIESAVVAPGAAELTSDQVAALDLLDSIANDPTFVLNMSFRPGDIQFLNNYKVWHARTEYVDHDDDARKRELYRLWLTLRDEIDLPPDFAAAGITNRSVAFNR